MQINDHRTAFVSSLREIHLDGDLVLAGQQFKFAFLPVGNLLGAEIGLHAADIGLGIEFFPCFLLCSSCLNGGQLCSQFFLTGYFQNRLLLHRFSGKDSRCHRKNQGQNQKDTEQFLHDNTSFADS